MEVDGDEGPVRHLLGLDSIKLMGESVGVTGLSDDAATRLGEDLEYRLKEIIQDAVKFMRHSKRKRLRCCDLDHALRAKNIEPLYGFECAEYLPFRHTSGGGKDLFYTEEKEIDLVDIISKPLPKLPHEVTLKAHWLAVDGTQPSVPENPPPMDLEEQRKEAVAVALPQASVSEAVLPPGVATRDARVDKKGKKLMPEIDSGTVVGGDWSRLKPLQAHALSAEQQLYYREIADACIGLSDTKRQEALTSLSTDPGLYQLLPQFCTYITEGVKVNVSQRKLNILKHLLKMVRSLLENATLSLEKYLHELIPTVLSCLINRQLCLRPEAEDHWGLRDLAAKVLTELCKKYSNDVNCIQSRVTRILSQALGNRTQGLAVHYGAIAGLAEFGQDSIKSLVIPRIKVEGELIRAVPTNKVVEHVAAGKLQTLLQRHCAPILMNSRPATDTLQMYQDDYGHLGVVLFNQVKMLRQNRAQASQQQQGAQWLQSPLLKSPTSLSAALTSQPRLNRPPPLTLPAQVKGNGTPRPKTPITSLSSPTIAAALRLVSQATSSSPAASSPATPIPASAVSILSAVMSTPSAQALLAGHLSSARNSVQPAGTSESSTATASTQQQQQQAQTSSSDKVSTSDSGQQTQSPKLQPQQQSS